jgi:hypothetical protein
MSGGPASPAGSSQNPVAPRATTTGGPVSQPVKLLIFSDYV